MAKCRLNVVVTDPGRPRVGGEKVRGTVIVQADENVNCRGLSVTSYWATHGAGNIDRGEIDHATLFEGSWEMGQEYRYAFELDSAAWPPSYYGHLLNVSQFIEARAKLSWASDPKATVEVPVVATEAPEGLAPVTKHRPTSLLGWVFGVVFGVLLLVPLVMLLGMLVIVVLPLALIAAAVTWFVRGYLPSRLTGRIECEVLPLRVAAGETIKGSVKFCPRKNFAINGVIWNLTATERCESGSGSNRKTRTHRVFQESLRFAEAGLLEAGVPQSYAFEFPVPPTVPASLKFSDNELKWEAEVRIDIPGWPDWVKTFKIIVTPAGNVVRQSPTDAPATASSTEALSFDELARLITALAVDPGRRRQVVEAVKGRSLLVALDLDSPEEDDTRAGTWLDGWHRPTDLDVEMLWPDGLMPPITPASGWKGTAVVTGFDETRDCLLMQAAPDGR